MRTNADITVVRLKKDGSFESFKLYGVLWLDKLVRTVSGKSVIKTAETEIHISEAAYTEAAYTDAIRTGDMIVKGTMDYTGLSSRDLRTQLEADNAVTVTIVSDFITISSRLKHVEVICE